MGILTFGKFILEKKEESPGKSGIVLLYDNKILLVHQANASWQKRSCGIPKGSLNAGEDELVGALRELKEETGIELDPKFLDPAPEVVQYYANGKVKQLTYFIARIDSLSDLQLETEKVPNSQLQLEEVDWAKFVDAETAYSLIVNYQLIILDRHLPINK